MPYGELIDQIRLIENGYAREGTPAFGPVFPKELGQRPSEQAVAQRRNASILPRLDGTQVLDEISIARVVWRDDEQRFTMDPAGGFGAQAEFQGAVGTHVGRADRVRLARLGLSGPGGEVVGSWRRGAGF